MQLKRLLSFEHGVAAYRLDYMVYALAILLLFFYLVKAAPSELSIEVFVFTLLGFAIWSPLEYVLHRFILHGFQPFKGWHSLHHQRPHALICSSTLLSATLVMFMVFVPTLMFGNLWRACALTLGLLIGYLAYATTHHAIHHWQYKSAWLARRKYWHHLHHSVANHACFGVTTPLWDYAFRTADATKLLNRQRYGVTKSQLDQSSR